jgi:two-component system, NtrC family, nitrogen regulation sensor histidine kinase NtrY
VTLAGRLLIAFGLLAVVSTASIGGLVRQAWRDAENARFRAQVDGAREGIRMELAWEQAAARNLLRPVCEHAAFVDQTLIDMQANRLDAGRRLALAQLVPDEMKALQLDELVLVTATGEILGSGHDPSLTGSVDPALASQLTAADKAFPTVRPPGAAARNKKPRPAALMARCTRRQGQVEVGLIGARYLTGIRDRIGKAYGVRLAIVGEPDASAREGEEVIEVPVDPASGLRLVAATSTRSLDQALARLDQVVLVAGGVSLLAAILIAVVLARSLANPIAQLASEVREVTSGEPRPVSVRGTREMRLLAQAFNKTLHDLATLRRRQAAMERIAAWREVARRVAHEIKNPLTPIRSSMETLRRLRARNDPQFDDYFEQATKGVLEDVHRIATIASDFARFARLPSPNPAPMDLVETARGVVSMHNTAEAPIELVAGKVPEINADRDQIVQVLTNLLQNAMDSVKGAGTPNPHIEVLVEPCRDDQVRIAIKDNGPGVPPELEPKLFEPYVTTKAHGTGLGLPIVQRIVIEHGGEISYAAAEGGGACFIVLLPKAGPGPSSSPSPRLDEA